MALTKKLIIQKVADETRLDKAKSVQAVEALIDILKSTLASGDDILISGFGKFCVKEKPPSIGLNPATLEPMMLRGRKVVTFKSSGGLRQRCNEKDDRQ